MNSITAQSEDALQTTIEENNLSTPFDNILFIINLSAAITVISVLIGLSWT